MKAPVAAALLGILALANAYGGGIVAPVRKLQTVPIARNYAAGAPAAPVLLAAAPAVPYGAEEEEPLVEEKVVFKAPVRILEKQPIRVSYNRDEQVREEPHHIRQSGYVHREQSAPVLTLRDRERDEALAEEYSRNAHYSFASAVDDGIMDQSHIRQETREGKKVTGTYAYSDGYFKRTVNYEADENGYRVVSELVEPISETGPQIDLVNGKAEVRTQISGIDTEYSVSADDLLAQRKKLAVLKTKEAAY